jgi:plasmid stabilization system protein ParE
MLSDHFKDDLSLQMDYLSKVAPKEVVQKTLDSLLTRVEVLKNNPYLGIEPRSSDIKNWGFRVLILDGYLVFYKVDETAKVVMLSSFFSSKQNYLIHLTP